MGWASSEATAAEGVRGTGDAVRTLKPVTRSSSAGAGNERRHNAGTPATAAGIGGGMPGITGEPDRLTLKRGIRLVGLSWRVTRAATPNQHTARRTSLRASGRSKLVPGEKNGGWRPLSPTTRDQQRPVATGSVGLATGTQSPLNRRTCHRERRRAPGAEKIAALRRRQHRKAVWTKAGFASRQLHGSRSLHHTASGADLYPVRSPSDVGRRKSSLPRSPQGTRAPSRPSGSGRRKQRQTIILNHAPFLPRRPEPAVRT